MGTSLLTKKNKSKTDLEISRKGKLNPKWSISP